MDKAYKNLQTVEKCPRNEGEWHARANALDCPKAIENEEEDEYHCVIADTGELELKEVCAPSKIILGL